MKSTYWHRGLVGRLDLALARGLLLILTLSCMGGCEKDAPSTDGGLVSCTVTETDSGALISCPDGTTAHIDNGSDGEESAPCSTDAIDGGVVISCPDGSQRIIDDGADVTVRTEPPGENCPRGGVAIVIEGEVVDYVCNGRGFPPCDVLHGDVLVRHNPTLELAAMAGCQRVEGDLTINNAASLQDLSSLEEVGGTLEISFSEVVDLQGLEALSSAGTILIANNPLLSSLEALTPEVIAGSTGGPATITVNGNESLSSCEVDDWFLSLDLDAGVVLNEQGNAVPDGGCG